MLNNSVYNSLVASLEKLQIKNSKFVLAVSGGVDSMVMLRIFLEICKPQDLIVVHFDHGVRADSNLDFDLLKSYLKEFNFDSNNLVLKKLQFESEANFEAEARKKRYYNLELIRKQQKSDLIVTAHHLDDQIETVFLNFLKGSFVDGLSGLANFDLNRKLLRPFLTYTKASLHDFATEFKVPYLTDSTNQESKHLRNYLRNDILPPLQNKIGSLKVLARNAEFFGELASYLDLIVKEFLTNNLLEGEIKRSKIMELPSFLRFKLYQSLLNSYPLSVADFKEIDSLVEFGVTGKFRQMGEIKFLINKKNLYIVVDL